MMKMARHYIEVCLQPEHLQRTLAITVLVGTWLTVFNQGDVLLSAGLTPMLGVKILLNYLTPFLVSNWGLVSRNTDV